ncbi:molybdopterin-dependent oxidoreductase [Phenylobacterium sp.]|uniref:molybdopterin-dependent oxidoreductase n=1 Tax=Phenylobacterium sp. TaxID=1871053 RepID=UPI00301B7BD0
MPPRRGWTSAASHWGVYQVRAEGGRVAAVRPWAHDPDPSPIGRSLLDAQDPGVRIASPAVRKGYLEGRGDGARRGQEPFVEVSWDEAQRLVAEALRGAQAQGGNRAIYGGSYGWASAGRFHHAQSQLHRFLNLFGGYTSSRNTYSFAAAEVIVPHVLGADFRTLLAENPPWSEIADHADLVVAFGGMAAKNMQVNNGGVAAHTSAAQMAAAVERGLRIVNISPLQDDVAPGLAPDWLPIRPGTDVALMLGLCQTLLAEGLHDRAFLDRCCSGFETFAAYLAGASDGTPKDAAWASGLTGVPAAAIAALARRMAHARTFINVSWSLQRAEHGEQPYWAAIALAAMLGQIGLPGRGIGLGVGAIHGPSTLGRRIPDFRVAALPQGRNPVEDFIPVARIADMLLNPGGVCAYDGATLTYPDIRLVYWAGGNPFHHHQDLNRLRAAWARPDTVVVHDSVWTATARHADLVLPATTFLERDDFAAAGLDHHVTPMPRVVPPFGEARSDFAIFAGLARRLGFEAEFTEGLSELAWVERLYEETRAGAAGKGVALPPFAEFFAGGPIDLGPQIRPRRFRLERFRDDPDGAPLGTPSGRIEIASQRIAAFGYADCRGHPAWYPKREILGAEGAAPDDLHLISNQPRTRLHSQFDHGRTSRQAKVAGREPLRIHPRDAAARRINDGALVRVHNARGACLAGAVLTDAVTPGVVELSTGAWYDPLDPASPQPLDLHGNPNAVTADIGCSSLSQGPAAHSCLVKVEPAAPAPAVRIFTLPPILKSEA